MMSKKISATIDYVGGNCPVQAEGNVRGLPFYFRSRGEHWTFTVALYPDGDAVGDEYLMRIMADHSEIPAAAGWMDADVAHEIVDRCIAFANSMVPFRVAEAIMSGLQSLHSERGPCAACGKRYGEHAREHGNTEIDESFKCYGLRSHFREKSDSLDQLEKFMADT